MNDGPAITTTSISQRIVTGRTITGMSAILLPYLEPDVIDWPAFEAHVARTSGAGLQPAVNMDTGYVQLLDDDAKRRVLDITASVAGDAFVAGAYVADQPGDPFDLAAYVAQCEEILKRGGTPVVFPSHGLNELEEPELVEALAEIGARADRFIGFELGTMFVPYGRILSLDGYRSLLDIPTCLGAKHSSLDRVLEFERLVMRDAVRPDFKVFTGNDLAIDMVMYGSDYLLGLSTFAPDLFAQRDAYWRDGDARFHELNDRLQYLGHFTFRDPVPGYRHDAAMFFELRGWAASDAAPTGAPRRPASDRDVLRTIAHDLGVL